MARPKGSGKKGTKAKAGAKGKGKAPAKASGGQEATESVAPSEAIRVTPAATLKSLLATCRGLKADMDEINGELREGIAYAVSKKNLKKGPFADLRKFDKMEAEKASEHWHTLVRYMELTGIMAKIESVGRLPLGDDDTKVEVEAAPKAHKAAAAAKRAAKKAAEAESVVTEGNSEAEEAAEESAATEAADAAEADAPQPDDPAPGTNVARPQFGQRQAAH